jgi:hypothetical protein
MRPSHLGRLPAHLLPALQRPTPSRCIRLHLDTHARLARCKRPGESFDALVERLLRHWRLCKLDLERGEEGP